MTDFDKYYEATEPGCRERAIGWATAIGLQDVGANVGANVGVKSKAGLKRCGADKNGEWYFER